MKATVFRIRGARPFFINAFARIQVRDCFENSSGFLKTLLVSKKIMGSNPEIFPVNATEQDFADQAMPALSVQ